MILTGVTSIGDILAQKWELAQAVSVVYVTRW